MNRQKWSEAGYTLVGVVLVFAILAVLGTSIVMLSFTSLKTSSMEHNDQAAFYIAEAGLNRKLKELETEIQSIFESSKNEDDFIEQLKQMEGSKLINDFEAVKNEKPEAKVYVELKKGNKLEVTSTGKIGNQSRTVSTEIEIIWEEKPQEGKELPFLGDPFVAFAKNKLTLEDKGSISGRIGTSSTKKNSIVIDNNHFTGEVYIPGGVINKDFIIKDGNRKNLDVKELDASFIFPDFLEIPTYPNLKELAEPPIENNTLYLNKPTYVKNFDLNKIIVSPGVQTLVVDKLSTKKSLEIVGLNNNENWELSLYVLDEIKFTGQMKINDKGDFKKLNIFYFGDQFKMSANNIEINGSIFFVETGKKKNIDINGGKIIGNIFYNGTNNIEMKNAEIHHSIIFAPHADVTIGVNGKFSGAIFANNITLGGNPHVSVIFDNKYNPKGPISPSALIPGGTDFPRDPRFPEDPRNPGEPGTGGTEASFAIKVGPIKEIEPIKED